MKDCKGNRGHDIKYVTEIKHNQKKQMYWDPVFTLSHYRYVYYLEPKRLKMFF